MEHFRLCHSRRPATRSDDEDASNNPEVSDAAWSEIFHQRASVRAARTGEEDIALWLYTSGTTGPPKAVMHRHRHLRPSPQAMSRAVLGMESYDVVLSVSRMFFDYGLGSSVYLPAAAGASVVLSETPILPAMIRDALGGDAALRRSDFYRGLVRLAVERPLSTLRMASALGKRSTQSYSNGSASGSA